MGSLHRSKRKRHKQGGESQKAPIAANETNIERQSEGPTIPRHHVKEILSYQPGEYGPSRNHSTSIRLSYEAVQEAQLDKKHRPGFKSRYKDGWSPEAIAHKAHLKAIIEIRIKVFGYHKRLKWTANSRQFCYDITQIVKAWRDKVKDKSRKIQMHGN